MEATNLHAQQIIDSYPEDSLIKISLELEWYPTTEEEMKAFMGTYLLSGIVQMKSWDDYFSANPYTFQPVMNNTFSKKRWMILKRFLYFETVLQPKENKLGKIWTIYNNLKRNFKEFWIPYQKVTCDEGKITIIF